MNYVVITGTSRGLGASLAKLFLEQGFHVVGVARNENKALVQIAQEQGVTYHHYTCHLDDTEQVDKVFSIIANQLFNQQTSIVYFIHNAGTVNPIDTIDKHIPEAINKHVHVNLIAPMIGSSIFLMAANKTEIPLINVYVTSGAAERSVYGWGAYSATKAGLNRYASTVALEQKELGTPHKAIIFDPSIMDTDMQKEIRSSSESSFQDVEQFKAYKRENNLRSTDKVAQVLVDQLSNSSTIENGKYYSVKNLLS
ncbi:SDR family NAD(P)-dependent oxidoreductase [Paraliobacillus ryukyuensis]|uniref:SDR family NAD(P)-dependent oxidoreductase n=1 Tax=Paraliobacillus ryukyuensis TaxID=200904 RepID=UPI0009A712AB|nr:SDR family NAD(P)-dependent oxidoreductase [Paraliobacillus ryukyuensis]